MRIQKTWKMTQMAMMTGVLCIIAPVTIPIPFSPVPMTLATFGIYMIASLLRTKHGILSVLTYILLGMVGLPIFSGFSSGIATLAGPTGGYVIGYLPCVFLSSWLLEKKRNQTKKVWYFFSFACGTLCCYLFGTIWFMIIMEGTYTIGQTLLVCVVPYLFFDIIKMLLATILVIPIKHRMLRSGGYNI